MSSGIRTNSIIYHDEYITIFKIISAKYGIFHVAVDSEDYDRIKIYNWHIRYDKNGDRFYAVSNIQVEKQYRVLYLSRFIMNVISSQLVVDHINHDSLNNTKTNLRVCSGIENGYNRTIYKSNTSGYKGVSWCRGYWIAYIYVKSKRIYLGQSNDKKIAAAMYNQAAIRYFGEFCKLNQI